MNTEDKLGIAQLVLAGIAIFIGLASWLTHIVASIAAIVGGGNVVAYLGLLFLGILFFPLGMIHGIGIWFGFF